MCTSYLQKNFKDFLKRIHKTLFMKISHIHFASYLELFSYILTERSHKTEQKENQQATFCYISKALLS